VIYRCINVAGVCRERDELVALLNARERESFETLSLVGQKNDSTDSSKHTTDNTNGSSVTAVKVHPSQISHY